MKSRLGSGDDGTTAVLGGGRRRKDDARVEAYGDVDELDAQIGVAVSLLQDTALATRLGAAQDDLHALAAVLAQPGDPPAERVAALEEAAARLEAWMREIHAALPPLTRFLRPGGTPAAAQIHLARTVCRRTERRVVSLGAVESVPAATTRYLNRLGDLLFALARLVNCRAGIPDCSSR